MARNTSDTPATMRADVEHAPGVRKRMRFLVANGGEGGHHHVETIEPGPALNEVKSRCARENDNRKSESQPAADCEELS